VIQTHRREKLIVDIQAGTHQMISDVRSEIGGTDVGPSPHEILEAALGACTSITVQMYANRKGWKLESCDAQVKFIQEDKQKIVLERVIELKGELDDTQKQRLFEIAGKCPIHEVLTRSVEVQSRQGVITHGN